MDYPYLLHSCHCVVDDRFILTWMAIQIKAFSKVRPRNNYVVVPNLNRLILAGISPWLQPCL